MTEIEQLVDRLIDPITFAEKHCGWRAELLLPDESTYEAAIEEIEWWADAGSNLEILKNATR